MAWLTSLPAKSVTSPSEKVTEPEPSSATAAMALTTASDQRGVGVPRPMVQAGCPGTPAVAAAARIWRRARSVSAEQLSKRVNQSSI